jgi:hypothetical protein
MPAADRLTPEERRSLTHGEFWIPERERNVYRRALGALNGVGIPYVVSGLYAIHAYTGVYRETKDLDLLVEPGRVVEVAETLKAEGFVVSLKEPHWLGQAFADDAQVDFIFGMGNGMGFVDAGWFRHSRPGILAAVPVRIAPPEELIWHRLFIGERHRFDMADVVHLILHRGHELDWDRLLDRVGAAWRLLLSQVHFFDFTYPDHRDRIPGSARKRLRDLELEAERVAVENASRRDGAAASGVADPIVEEDEIVGRRDGEGPLTRGTLLSRYSFAIDVNEWGFHDARLQRIARVRHDPIVQSISSAEVWDG